MRRALLAAVALAAAAVALAVAIERVDVLPRRLAAYVEHRASGHTLPIESAAGLAARALLALDRGFAEPFYLSPLPAARSVEAADDEHHERGRMVLVGTPPEALDAIAHAEPGDAITFLPGIYRFSGVSIPVQRPGMQHAPIVVRGASAGSVVLEFDMVEGFLVSVPFWSFEDLSIRGVCADHSKCEHAFHVVADGAHFIARRNTIADFNAHFKINGSGGITPDYGVIDDNVLTNTRVRQTGNPVTPIDLVAASHWRIRGNHISDFVKAEPNRISYGAFAKGGGSDNRFEGNVVICEDRLRNAPGQRVGLSLGGGGSGDDSCRGGRCITEQDRGVIAANLIASCSDDGIYLNRAAMSAVTHNTLIDTGGITARFGETSAYVDGNLVDGVIRGLQGAVVHADDNVAVRLPELYIGLHRVRDLFVDASALDLRWRGEPPRRSSGTVAPPGLCGMTRAPQPAYGAFEDIARCALGPR